MPWINTKWDAGNIYKFLHNDKKTIVFIEILGIWNTRDSSYKANKFWINNQDHEYMIEFNKIFTGVSITAEKTTREEIFRELFR